MSLSVFILASFGGGTPGALDFLKSSISFLAFAQLEHVFLSLLIVLFFSQMGVQDFLSELIANPSLHRAQTDCCLPIAPSDQIALQFAIEFVPAVSAGVLLVAGVDVFNWLEIKKSLTSITFIVGALSRFGLMILRIR